jgi:amino acid adenylation domain-containing protein
MNQMQNGVLSGFPLSSHQRRVWLQQQGAGVLCSQVVVSVQGHLDGRLMKAALRRIVARHDILRTTFHVVEGVKMPLQVVTTEPAFSWEESAVNADDEDALTAICAGERRREFDLENGPNLRLLFLPVRDHASFLVITLPSLCADVGTLNNMVREFAVEYRSQSNLQSSSEPVQYVQFSEWHHSLFEDEDAKPGREYWSQQAKQNTHGDLRFPFESGRAEQNGKTNKQKNQEGRLPTEMFRLDLGPEIAARIKALAMENRTSHEAVLLTCWNAVLWRLSAQPAHATWMSLSGRDHEMLSGCYGLLATPVPVQWSFESPSNFNDALARTHDALREAAEWQPYYRPDQFEDQICSSVRMGFEFDEGATAYGVDGICFSKILSFHCPEDVDLKLSVITGKKSVGEKTAGEDSLSAQIYYDPRRFSAGSVREFMLRLQTFLAHLHGKKFVDEIEIQSEDEWRKLLSTMNPAASGRNIEKTIPQVFEEQVARTPGRPAVVYEQQTLTFSELNVRANRLANHLRGLGIKSEDRVAICLERSAEIVVAILGILKAGAAYVPLDSTYPAPRLRYILQEAGSSVIVTQRSLAVAVSPDQVQTVCLDDDQEIVNASDQNPRTEIHPENLAYIIYTSGSTGKPKGVMIQHKSVINLLDGLQQSIYARHDQPLRVSMNAPVVFDGSVKQWIQLLAGNTLCIVPEDKRLNPEALRAYIEDKNIDLLDCTPSQFKLLLASGASGRSSRLKAVLLGGEALDEQIWTAVQSDPQTSFYNVYGPTECTVDVTVCPASESFQPSIGRPLNDVQAYILDGRLRPVPIGVAGELYVGGEGIARGYCRRPDITAERFIPNPFSVAAGTRLYRTGDRVCYLPDGRIKFLGRVDEQVKLRGYRIELGEIASVLRDLEGVRDVLVLVRGEEKPGNEKLGNEKLGYENNDARLVAYIVREAGATLSGAQLRQHVRSQLPDYMVPSGFVIMDKLPLTVNGKVDRKSLPDADRDHSDMAADYVAPRSDTEKTITGIWQELLNVKKLGIHDNFFDLGGHSLLMVQLYNKLREAFHKEIPMVELFRNPTIAMLSQYFSGDTPQSPSLQKAQNRASRRLAAVSRSNN